MIKNNGEKTNSEVFWNPFASKYGENALKDSIHFVEFYKEDYDKTKETCGYNPLVKEVNESIFIDKQPNK